MDCKALFCIVKSAKQIHMSNGRKWEEGDAREFFYDSVVKIYATQL